MPRAEQPSPLRTRFAPSDGSTPSSSVLVAVQSGRDQTEDRVSRQFGSDGLVGRGLGSVEVGTCDADLGDVLAQYRDGVLGSDLLDLVPLGVATAAERDLAARAGVEHPVRGSIAGHQPALAAPWGSKTRSLA